MDDDPGSTAPVTRRTVLSTAAVGGLASIAGCLGDGADGPDPIALDDGQACDNCDMQIDMHPGPVGQAFYLDDPPAELPDDREDGLAHFCSGNCTYTFILEQAEFGVQPAVAYATDYSEVAYDLREDDGETVISAHLDAASFVALADLTHVVDSDVEGSMGGSVIGFSNADDAEAFADDHGGAMLEHDEITLEVVAGLGM